MTKGWVEVWAFVALYVMLPVYGVARLVRQDPPVRSWRGALAVGAIVFCLVTAGLLVRTIVSAP